MKILHILDHYLPLFSGYTFRTSYILKNQRAVLGHEPVAVTSVKQGPTETGSGEFEAFDGVRVYRTPVLAKDGPPVVREYRQMQALKRSILEVAAKERPAVLHAHSPVLNAWPAIWAGRKLGIPVVYEIRAFWEDAAVDHGSTKEGSLRYRATRALETRACQKADAVVTICEGLRKGLLERGLRRDKLFVLPNGVETANFPPPDLDAALQASLGLQGRTVVGFIGSLYRYEGLSLLLEAVAKMAPRRPDLACLIVGSAYDNEEEELRQQARRLGIEDRVKVTGKVPHKEVNGYYSLIDVLVYPRIRSRLLELVTPLKPLEAMSMEKVVAGSDVGGIKELIEHGKNGVLFKADDPADMAETLLALLDNPAERERLRKAARVHVDTNRSWNKLIEAHREVYSYLGLRS